LEFKLPINAIENEILSITFKAHSSTKKTKEYLAKLNEDNYKNWHKQNKAFGESATWIALQVDEYKNLLTFFNLGEEHETNWYDAKRKTVLSSNNFFITPKINDWVFILGWEITDLNVSDKNNTLKRLSETFGDIYIFENLPHHATFKWGHIKNGTVIRFYHEATFKVIQEIGEQTQIERNLKVFEKKQEKFNMEEEYYSDQDYKRNYIKYMNDFVLKIATIWSTNPMLNNECNDLPEHVYLFKSKQK
jgi:hypothetical protein